VQDIKIQLNNTKYRRGVWKTADGKLIWGKLPECINGHYGNELKSYVIAMYHSMHVPQNKIHAFLREIGVQVSAGEIDRILSVDKDIFHKEKEEILETGLKISPYVVTDDTGHRHKGINGYCTHIGNDLFAYFQSSARKNRINFLKILGGVGASYCINGFSINYYKKQRISEFTLKLLKRANGREFKNDSDWQEFLKRLGIKDKYPVRIATEGALIGGLYKYRIHPALAIVSDDAGQFDVLLHALCWIHTERILTSLNTVSEGHEKMVKEILNDFWNLFKDLQAFKNQPSIEKRNEIENMFDVIFSRQTSWLSLDRACKSIAAKKRELLLVLDIPIIPLSNNTSERDLRDAATKRKISAGTRSDAGRDCRDTFMSLKKTCLKQGISFISYIRDRLDNNNKIPRLTELMICRAKLLMQQSPAF
jgi:Transposase IS66 family